MQNNNGCNCQYCCNNQGQCLNNFQCNNSSLYTWLIVGGVLLLMCLLCVIGCLIICKRKRSRVKVYLMKRKEMELRGELPDEKHGIAIGIVVPSKIPINNIKIRSKTQSFLSKFKTHQSDRSISNTTKPPSNQTTFKHRSQSIQSVSSEMSSATYSHNSQRTLIKADHRFSQLIPPIAQVMNHFKFSRQNSSKISESEVQENIDTPTETVGHILHPMLDTLKSCDLNTMEVLMHEQERGQTDDSQVNFINQRIELSRESSSTLHLNNNSQVTHKGTRAAHWFQFGKGVQADRAEQKRKLSRQQIIHKSLNIESSVEQNLDKVSDLSPMNVRGI